jgi:hypothetical protein
MINISWVLWCVSLICSTDQCYGLTVEGSAHICKSSTPNPLHSSAVHTGMVRVIKGTCVCEQVISYTVVSGGWPLSCVKLRLKMTWQASICNCDHIQVVIPWWVTLHDVYGCQSGDWTLLSSEMWHCVAWCFRETWSTVTWQQLYRVTLGLLPAQPPTQPRL